MGGGTAGCVLAARLSADSRHSVLLIEAGEYFNWLSTVPLLTPMLQGSAQDWAYRTKPQIHSSWGLSNQASMTNTNNTTYLCVINILTEMEEITPKLSKNY